MAKPNEDKIPCAVCRELIPKAAALHAEGEGYVEYFCGPECLAQWKKENPDRTEGEK